MKITVETILHQNMSGGGFVLFAVDMSKYGYIPVGPVEVECEVPDDFNPIAARVAMLEKKLDSMSADYQRNCAAIRGQISDMQCIEHSPAGAA